MMVGNPFTSKIDSNHTIYHVHNAETANPVDWYLISGEGDCGEGDCGEGDCGEGDCGEGEWIPFAPANLKTWNFHEFTLKPLFLTNDCAWLNTSRSVQ